jgi:ubiquitin-protein ligase
MARHSADTLQRIRKDIRAAANARANEPFFLMAPIGGDLTRLQTTIFGPEDTPYEGGMFEVLVIVPWNFPSHGPLIKFKTRVYHPNVLPDGTFCICQLRDDWRLTYRLGDALQFVSDTLEHPNWEWLAVTSIVEEHKYNRELFEQKAKEWTQQYASE